MTEDWPSTPEEYASAIQQYNEIPSRYRLETFENEYQEKDIWGTYVEDVVLEQHDSERMQRTLRLSGEAWMEHMQGRGRHYATGSPLDVNEWCNSLLEEKARRTCYDYYFVRIYDFYEYLKYSVSHPHLYNPFLIAATQYDAARYIWMHRVDERERGDDS